MFTKTKVDRRAKKARDDGFIADRHATEARDDGVVRAALWIGQVGWVGVTKHVHHHAGL